MKYRVFLIALTVFYVLGQEANARSTFTVRASTPGIAGPEISHVLTLYLHYFPGDGEAIVRSEIVFDPQQVNIAKVVSSLGKSKITSKTIEVDYAEQPVGSKGVDTLAVVLQAQQAPALLNLQGRIYSSLDYGAQSAHSLDFQLAVQPPVEMSATLTPLQLFPGEKVNLQAVLYNKDAAGRGVRQVRWQWPDGLVVVAGDTLSQWEGALASGTRDTLNWTVKVDRSEPGRLALAARARTDEVAGTPLLLPQLEVLPVPIPQLEYVDGTMEVGQAATFVYRWDNPAASAIAVEALTIEIPTTFSGVEVIDPPDGLTVTQPIKGQSGRIRLDGKQILTAGGTIRLTLRVRPERPGPFAWRSWFRPVGHTEIPLLAGKVKVDVAGATLPIVDLNKEERFITDLEFMSAAFKTALGRELNGLPLAPGTQVRLQPEEKGDKNWIVDDLLTRTLMDDGFVVTLKEPVEGSQKVHNLYYRLADSKVIYSKVKKGWLPFISAQKREAQGNLFLRLTTDQGQLAWVSQVKAFAAERVDVENVELLGDSKLVERAVIEPEHKLIERGLSASIIGGLVVIFFAP